MAVPKIDKSKCNGCGECVDACPMEVIEMKDEKAVVAKPDDCTECGTCVEVCEPQAITLPEK